MASLNRTFLDGPLPTNVEPLQYNRFKKGYGCYIIFCILIHFYEYIFTLFSLLFSVKGGVVHFGLGNFHRSHQAMYLDKLFATSDANEWGVVGVGLLPADIPIRDAMKEQDCLYTLHEKAPDGETKIRVMQAMVEYIYAPDNFEAVVQRLMDPNIKIVSLTITEGGYILNNRGEFIQDHPTVKKVSLLKIYPLK